MLGANLFEPYLAHERLFGAVVQNAKEIDANKDGLINEEELTTWLDKMARVNDLPRAAQRLELCDANRDSELTFDEYTRCTYGVGENQLLRTTAGDYHHGFQFMHSERIRFDAADEDRNHRLSIKEMAMFLWPQHYSSMEEMQASMVLAMMDSNHDMAVTFDEFVSEESGGQKLPGLVDSAMDHFLHMDKNQDNQLTTDELKPWFTPSLHNTIKHEAKILIEKIDLNGDHLISLEEVEDAKKTWSVPAPRSNFQPIREEA
ncbi:hypothetical protein D915_010031 [Fasciola hepatica]|uniref:EF-hand domain-containing protein n=1 Tax=Fasciola hepatica TaxID=6192 RepID=A0A4E0RCW5_FASHE|nr:hypothetical protein D915_010031 [Fasciola hepatica]